MAGAGPFWQTAVVLFRTILALGLMTTVACTKPGNSSTPPTQAAAELPPKAVLERLEADIEAGTASEADREQAYAVMTGMEDDGTADYAFARAAVAGRLAELRGLGAGKLVTEAETFARLTLERDPEYDDGAATRMLGTLYVMAPARLVEHGDAEDGLSMLEDLTTARPDDPRNHLRTAEAFINLDDPDPAVPYLCEAARGRATLRRDEAALLDSLVDSVAGDAGLACD